MTTDAATDRRPRLTGALLLAFFAVLVLVRMPEIVLKGRFWAEEGQIFFAAAWSEPPLRALFDTYGGYLNIVATGATLLARLALPLPLAPYLTIAVGLFFQLVPPFLLLRARDRWLDPLPVRLAGLALVLLVPGTEEIWLQTLHCQFELTLASAIILALEPAAAGVAGAISLLILALAPLCGPGAVVLVPLFLLRAVLDRSASRLVEGLTLGASSALQLLLFVAPFTGRTYRLDPALLLSIVTIRHLVEPFFGLKVGYLAGGAVRRGLASGHLPVWTLVLPFASFVPFAVALWRTKRAVAARWFALAALVTGLAAYYGAIGGLPILIGAQSGERYVFVPQALLGLSILGLAATRDGLAPRIATVAIVWLVVVGIGTYTSTLRGIRNGPAWRDEVRAWRHDPSDVLRIWPHGWTVTLTVPSAHAAAP